MILLYKESALSPLAVAKVPGALFGVASKAVTWPAMYMMMAAPFLGDNPVTRGVQSTYGRIPIVGETLFGGMPKVDTEDLSKIKDPGVRSQLFRTQDGSYFSPKGTMHGSDAIKHHLMSNISVSEADRNNPIFKNIRELSTNPDSSRAFQNAAEQGRTAYLHAPGENRHLMSRLSPGQRKEVTKQQGRFLDSMVGAVIGKGR